MMQPSISTFFRASKKRGREGDEVGAAKGKLQAVVGGVGDDGRDLPAKKEVVTLKEPLVKFVHKAPCSPQKNKKVSGGQQQQMTKEEVKKLLDGKGKLRDLQKALQSINGAAKKIEALRSIKATAAAAGSGGVVNNPVIVPAYQRYSHLLEGVESRTTTSLSSPSKLCSLSPSKKAEGDVVTLPLPYKYRVLEELFKGVETVCHIMEGRSETLSLVRLREGVFSLFKKVKLTEGHFAQFLSVLPNSFTVKWEGNSKKGVDLVVVRPEGVRGSRAVAFRKALQDVALKHHQTYLLSLDPPLEVERGKIRRWHPSFRLDVVPDIPEVQDFPLRPVFDVVSNAKDVLAKVKEMVAVNERMQRALYKSAAAAAAAATEKMPSPAAAASASEAAAAVVSPRKKAVVERAKTVRQLKGVSQALLDKIRLREQEKRVKVLTLSKAEAEESSMVDRLPSVVRVIHNIFVGERKAALGLDLVLERISHSCSLNTDTSSSRDWCRRCVEYLSCHYSDFLTLHELSESTFVKIDKQADINALCIRIKAHKTYNK